MSPKAKNAWIGAASFGVPSFEWSADERRRFGRGPRSLLRVTSGALGAIFGDGLSHKRCWATEPRRRESHRYDDVLRFEQLDGLVRARCRRTVKV